MNDKYSSGFTLIELVAVMVIVSVISVSAVSRMAPTGIMQVQAAKDQVLAALFHAQQKALFKPNSIRVITLGSTIDIREDANNDGLFPATESIRVGSVTYPLTLVNNAQISSHTINYTSLGEAPATTLSISVGGRNATVVMDATGFAR